MIRLWTLFLCLAISGCTSTQQFGPIDPAVNGREVWIVPGSGGFAVRAVIYRPSGPGPFPLALISHGSSEDQADRTQMSDPDYPYLAKWLNDRGFVVVIPQRPGHGQSAGPYLETAGSCEQPNFKAAGLASAAVLQSVIDYMREQNLVARGPVLVIGHSAGGWASLALASSRPELVRAVVVFAAGRGGRANNLPNTNCGVDSLIGTAGEFGNTARAPVLWVYSKNDSYFSPALGRNIAAAYSKGGSPSVFLEASPITEDGHFFVHDRRAVATISGPLQKLLAQSASR